MFFTLTGTRQAATQPRRRSHDRHARPARPSADAAARDRRPRPRRRAGLRTLRHALALAKRSLIKTMRTPEALIDVTLQPIIFLLLFTYVFGGAIAGGSQHQYLQFLLPGLLGQGIAMAGVALGQNLNADIEKGVFDRFRSLPIARSAPLVGAVLADIVALLHPVRDVPRASATSSASGSRRTRWRRSPRSGISIAFALCFCWISVFIGMIARTSGVGAGDHVPDRLAAVVRQQRVRQHLDAAGLAAGVREGQSDHPPGRHRPRPDAGRPGARTTWAGRRCGW